MSTLINGETWQVIVISLKVAFYSTFLVMSSSMILAPIFAFNKSKIIKAFEMCIYLPLAMPPVALGYGLLLLLGPNTSIGKFLERFDIYIAFNFLGAVLAAFVVSLGIGVRTLRVAVESIDIDQCEMASILGATRAQIYWHIIFPQCRSAMFGGGILVFIRALSEFGATMVLAGNYLGTTRTLALAIWVGIQIPGKERDCIVLVMIALFISALALVTSEFLLPLKKN